MFLILLILFLTGANTWNDLFYSTIMFALLLKLFKIKRAYYQHSKFVFLRVVWTARFKRLIITLVRTIVKKLMLECYLQTTHVWIRMYIRFERFIHCSVHKLILCSSTSTLYTVTYQSSSMYIEWRIQIMVKLHFEHVYWTILKKRVRCTIHLI